MLLIDENDCYPHLFAKRNNSLSKRNIELGENLSGLSFIDGMKLVLFYSS